MLLVHNENWLQANLNVSKKINALKKRVEKEALLMAPWCFVRYHLIRIQDGGGISNQYDCSVTCDCFSIKTSKPFLLEFIFL